VEPTNTKFGVQHFNIQQIHNLAKNKCLETSKKGGNKMIIVKKLKHIDDGVKRKIGVANIVWSTRIVGNKRITKINIHEIV
jgi:hypothetical protein